MWSGAALGLGLLVIAWVLFVAGLVSGFGDLTGTVGRTERWAFWSLATAALLASGPAAAYVSGRKTLLLLPVFLLGALGVGALIASVT